MRLRSVMLAALALCFSAPAVAADDEAKRAARMVEKAGELIGQKKPAEALAILGAVISSFEKQHAAAAAKGDVYCASSPQESLVYLLGAAATNKSASVLSPTFCDALFLQAFVLTELGRQPEAVAALEELTAMAPMKAQYFVELGYAYRVTGNIDKAMKSYQQALETSTMLGKVDADGRLQRARALRGIGYLLIDRNDLEGAMESYRKSLVEDPGNALAQSEIEYIEKLQQNSR